MRNSHGGTTIYAETLSESHKGSTNIDERMTVSTQTENTDTDGSVVKEFNLVKYKGNVMAKQNN